VNVLAVRGFNLGGYAPHDWVSGIVTKIGITVGEADKYLRINTVFSTVVKASRHMSTAPTIELKGNFFTTFEFVMSLYLRVCVDDVNFVRSALRDDA
jgi:hypothetical protein